MANIARGELTLHFDGVGTRTFKWAFYEVGVLEGRLKMGLMKILSEEQMGANVLYHALWAGYMKEDPTITPKKVAGWISRGTRLNDAQGELLGLGELINAVMLALAKAIPQKEAQADDEDGDSDPPPAAAAPSSAPTAE